MDVIARILDDRLEFSWGSQNATVRPPSGVTDQHLWVGDFQAAVQVMRRGLAEVGASQLSQFKPSVVFVFAQGDSHSISAVEKSSIEAAAYVGGAGRVNVRAEVR